MADDIRNPADLTKVNWRGGDWYEPSVQAKWSCQKRTPCPPMVNSAQVYGHNGAQKYTATYFDDLNDPDIIAPEVNAVVTGTLEEGDYVGSATVTITATDVGVGVTSRQYSVTGGAPWTTYTVPVVYSTPGTYTVTYRATDGANNVSANKSVTFTVVAA